jgi:hypothetical protein
LLLSFSQLHYQGLPSLREFSHFILLKLAIRLE